MLITTRIQSREICLKRDNLERTTTLRRGVKGLNKALKRTLHFGDVSVLFMPHAWCLYLCLAHERHSGNIC